MSSNNMYADEQSLSLSPQQIWRLQDQNVTPCIAVIALTGQVDVDQLHNALNALIARHDALQTQLAQVEGFKGPRQVIDPEQKLVWTVLDYEQHPLTESALQDVLCLEQEQLLESAQSSALRATLVRISATDVKLILVLNKAASDYQSMITLLLDLTTLYTGSQLEIDEPLQYSAFCAWLAELAEDEGAEQGFAYWSAQTAQSAERPALRLPYRQSAIKDSKTKRTARLQQSTQIDQQLHHDLLQLATSANVDLSILLQSAWWALLARISGQAQFTATWIHDSRQDYEDLAGAVGAFARPLPVQIDIENTPTLVALIEGLAQQVDQHREWQEFWQPSTGPFAIGFEWATTFASHPKIALLTLTDDSAAELLLRVNAQHDSLQVTIHYAQDRYSDLAIETLLGQYLQTLKGLLMFGLDQQIAQLSCVSGTEAQRLLAWQGDHLEIGTQTLPELIQQWATQTPHALAVQDDEGALSYAELLAASQRLARLLVEQGVGAETVVALLLPRGRALITTLIAVWLAGGAYLALDPEWPIQRVQQLIDDASPHLVVTAKSIELSRTIPELSIANIYSRLNDYDAGPLDIKMGLEHAAYLLYTSGSTGQPKGVVVEHRQLLNYVEAVSQAIPLDKCRHVGLTATVAADLGHTALFGALRHGACLHIADANTVLNAHAFSSWLGQHAIDCLKIVPSHFEALLSDEPSPLPAVLIFGGEAVSMDLARRIRTCSPSTQIFNHYGPTETTVGVLTHRIAEDVVQSTAVVPLDYILANNKVYVLDKALQLTPTGATGELYIGGANLSRGYLGQAQHPAFIQSPFDDRERLYRSGDLARYRSEGGLELVGRADHQVKIRGFRLELGEVEHALATLAGIRQAVVITHGVGAEQQLHAFVVTEHDQVDVVALRASLGERLPDAMIPARLIQVQAMPRLANGKIDRQVLPALVTLDQSKITIAPRNAIEWVLASLWTELLGLTDRDVQTNAISVDDNFVELGGHSLLAIKLVARIRKQLQVDLPPGAVFEYPTIASQAEALQTLDSSGRLQAIAQARRQLAEMTPEQRAALLAKRAAAGAEA